MWSSLVLLAAAIAGTAADPTVQPYGVPLSVEKIDSQYPRAVPFGASEEIQTLTPRHEVYVEPEDDNATLSDAAADEDVEAKYQALMADYRAGKFDIGGDEDDEDDDDEDTSPNHGSTTEIFKRAPQYCGVFRMNCYTALSACTNGCYYQNCVNRGSTLPYRDAGGVGGDENRVKAGTTVSTGTPCRNIPISQYMYDKYPNWASSNPDLETDEWPMAAMQQPAFVNNGGVQNTLRCIKSSENGDGGNQLKSFRRGEGVYSPGGGSRKKAPGALWPLRNGCRGVLRAGDTYDVQFDISMFLNQGAAGLRFVQDVMPYCMLSNTNCANDGRQFHMTKLRRTAGGTGQAGIMDFPYALSTMNNYQVTGQAYPMESFNVKVTITGSRSSRWSAKIYQVVNAQGTLQRVGSNSNQDLAVGQTLTVPGLTKNLYITRTGSAACSRVDFQYGNSGDLQYFPFNSNSYGFDNAGFLPAHPALPAIPATGTRRGKRAQPAQQARAGKLTPVGYDSRTVTWPSNPPVTWTETIAGGKYCKSTDIRDSNGNNGVELSCWFPGW